MRRTRILHSSTLIAATLWLWGVAGGHEAPPSSTRAQTLPIQPAEAPAPKPEPVQKESSVRRKPTQRTQRVANRPASQAKAKAEPLEIDLELDPSEKLLELLEKYPREVAAARTSGGDLLFAHGYALKGAGHFAEALEPLTAYHKAQGRLAPYAALLLGEACLELKRFEEAATWLNEALATFTSGERQVQARYALARLQLLKGEAALAVKELEQLVKDAPKSARRHEIKLKLAQAYEKNGQLEKAIETMEWLWAWAPSSTEAETASREIARFQESKTAGYTGPNAAVRYRRALRLLSSGQVEPGLTLMLALAQDPAVTATLPRRFALELAKAYFQAKQYTEAAEHFDAWYGRATAAERPEALFWRALTQGRLARYEESIALYRQLARAYPKSGYAERAWMKIGLLRLDQGRYAQSEEAFTGFRDRFPRSSNADTAVWYIAWTQLRQGRYAAANATYDDFVRRFPRSSLMPGVRYWQGRVAQLEGDKAQAIAHYRQVLQSPIASHYAPLAEVRLSALGQPLEKPPEKPPEPERAPELPLPHPEVLERTTSLLGLGLRNWAQLELLAYEHSLKSRDEFLALAAWYRKTGNYAGARLIVANLGQGEGVPKLRDPGLAWQLSYPLAYKDHLQKVTLPPKVPIELIYAVMRQESEFRPWATSKAGARGLMQVMPETANEVCQSRKVPSPNVKQLYRPELSVQYGAWHLEDLMNRLDGRLPLVIAGYNAGPEAVERWMKERPVDPIDVFIEEISYSETRRYVKKVLTNLWTYRRLYADGQTPLRNEPHMDQPIAAVKPVKPSATPDDETALTDAPEAAE